MLLGDKIKQLRKNLKMTQDELADKVYVSRQTISNWENNKSFPSMDFIVSLSNIFNISIDILIKEDLKLTKEEIDKQRTHEEKSLAKQKLKIIRKNKYRIVLNRFLFLRIFFLWNGTLLTSYFYFSKNYLDYIWLPIFIIIFSLSTTIPIEKIKKKYQIKNNQDLKKFLDALYQ